MTRDEFATMLHGRGYGNEMSKAEEKIAKDAGLLVIFGASDDLIEFRGVFSDETDAYGGRDVRVANMGDDWGVYDQDHEWRKGFVVYGEWCPESFEGSWRIGTELPHATFDIMEEEDLFCRGIVISLADMEAAPRLTKDECDLVNNVIETCKRD